MKTIILMMVLIAAPGGLDVVTPCEQKLDDAMAYCWELEQSGGSKDPKLMQTCIDALNEALRCGDTPKEEDTRE